MQKYYDDDQFLLASYRDYWPFSVVRKTPIGFFIYTKAVYTIDAQWCNAELGWIYIRISNKHLINMYVLSLVYRLSNSS